MPYIKLLIDLDGTLTDTNGDEFDDIKYGRNRKFELHDIPLIDGAVDFIQHVKTLGHSVAIVSDSHPAYVERMANEVFGVPCLSLTDKPNTEKICPFLHEMFDFPNNAKAEDFLFIGDTELDIHIARRLKIPSVFLGDDFELRLGATYYCKNYQDILKILKNPATHRFVLEDKVGQQTAVFLNEKNQNNGYTMIRGLARQHQGLCDKFGALMRYNNFQNKERSTDFVCEIAEDVSSYLRDVVCAHPDKFSWDYITCVPDKETTIPPKKMEEFLSAIDIPIPKEQIFAWSPDTEGSIRKQGPTNNRLDFANKFLLVQKEPYLKDKNVIVIDDNYTTGATTNALSEKLLNEGVQNILFLCLFYLADDVPSEKNCPNCGKILQVKTNRTHGNRFLACVPPEYGGTGCGWKEPKK